MKKLYLLLAFAFCFIFYGVKAEGEEFLFSFNGPAVMPFSADNTIEAVNAEHGLYTSSDEEYLKELLNAGVISYYEPVGYAELFDYVPEDKYYSNQQSFMDMINVPFAWNKDNFGQGVKIAVIDSGLSTHASEFPLEYVTRAYDYINPDAPPSDYCEDTFGHGTFVAGIISAEHNAWGVAGISPFSKLYVFRCFENRSIDTLVDIIDAIYKAVDEYGCDIINISFGCPASKSLKAAIDHAYSKGALIVAAAGNDGKNSGSKVYYPAAYENVICVGSVNASGHTASHSQRNDYVNIMAPGENVWSVALGNAGYYKSDNGTSFATPHVTAAAALAKSLNPGLTNKELTNLLYLSADPMIDRYSGHGRMNVQSLLTLCRSSLSPNSLVYSVSGKKVICAVTPSEGFTSFMAVYDGDSALKSVSSDRLVVLPSADFDTLRLFIWKKETLIPFEAEISKTQY